MVKRTCDTHGRNLLSEMHDPVYETLQLEIISVIESLNQLRESPDYELCQLSGQKAGVLDELASERARLLDQ